MLSAPLLNIVETLHKFTLSYPITILTFHEGNIIRDSQKLFFDYGSEIHADSLYLERTPGGTVQVYPNTTGEESKVNLEALFNAVHAHKETIKSLGL